MGNVPGIGTSPLLTSLWEPPKQKQKQKPHPPEKNVPSRSQKGAAGVSMPTKAKVVVRNQGDAGMTSAPPSGLRVGPNMHGNWKPSGMEVLDQIQSEIRKAQKLRDKIVGPIRGYSLEEKNKMVASLDDYLSKMHQALQTQQQYVHQQYARNAADVTNPGIIDLEKIATSLYQGLGIQSVAHLARHPLGYKGSEQAAIDAANQMNSGKAVLNAVTGYRSIMDIGSHPVAGTFALAGILPFFKPLRIAGALSEGTGVAIRGAEEGGRISSGLRAGRDAWTTDRGLIRPAFRAGKSLLPKERKLAASQGRAELFALLDHKFAAPVAQSLKRTWDQAIKATVRSGAAESVDEAVGRLASATPDEIPGIEIMRAAGEDGDFLAQMDIPNFDRSLSAEEAAKNLRQFMDPKNLDKGGSGNEAWFSKHPESGGHQVIGKLSDEAWWERTQHSVGYDRELGLKLAYWYQELGPLFMHFFGEDAHKILRGFAVSQANASPSGGLLNVLRVRDLLLKDLPVPKDKISTVVESIEQALRGEKITKGMQAKLHDFADSLEGKKTRTWVGDHPEGGSPTAADIHAQRDLGRIDPKILSTLRNRHGLPVAHLQLEVMERELARLKGKELTEKFTATAKRAAIRAQNKKIREFKVSNKDAILEGRKSGLKLDNPQASASDNDYNAIVREYKAITDYLNEIGAWGKHDWTPAETQALGWSAIQRFHGVVPEDAMAAIDRNTHLVSFETGNGIDGFNPATGNWKNDLAATRAQEDNVRRIVLEEGGIWRDVHYGPGGYEDAITPSVQLRVIASPEQANAIAERLANEYHQWEVWAQRPGVVNSKKVGRSRFALELESTSFKTKAGVEKFWKELQGLLTTPKEKAHLAGFAPYKFTDPETGKAVYGIRIVTGHGYVKLGSDAAEKLTAKYSGKIDEAFNRAGAEGELHSNNVEVRRHFGTHENQHEGEAGGSSGEPVVDHSAPEGPASHAGGAAGDSEELGGGFPDALFQREGGDAIKGYIQIVKHPDGRVQDGLAARIGLTKKADVTTAIHELGHFLAYFGLSSKAKSVVEGWVGKRFEEWGVPEHEMFARGFEAYFAYGKAPNTLKAEFEKLAPVFREMYPNYHDLPELTPEMEKVFAQLLGHRDGLPAAVYFMMRNKVVASVIARSHGPARSEEEARQHVRDVNEQLRQQGHGIKESEITNVEPGQMPEEFGGELGHRIRGHIAGRPGFVDPEEWNSLGHYGQIGAKLDLPSQRVAREQQLEGYSRQRRQRVAKGSDAFGAAGGGLAGHYAAKGKLAGEFDKVSTSALDLSTDEANHLADWIEEHPKLKNMFFARRRATDALLKLSRGETLQANEERLLGSIFGRMQKDKSFRAAWHQASWGERALELVNVPRALQSMLDFSAFLRQGLVSAVHNPRAWGRQIPGSFKAAGSEASYEEWMASITEMDSHALMVAGEKDDRISFTGANEQIGQREEGYQSALAERIWGVGHLVRMSDRSYTGFLNGNRAAAADALYLKAARAGWDLSDEAVRGSINRFVNSATGRGSLGVFESHAATLNALLFSPRLLWSRLNFLNPIWYAMLHPFVRRQALTAMFRLIGLTVGVLELAHLGGAKVVLDPTNADFAKVKIGNTRIDFLGGFQQPVRVASQLYENRITSSTTGISEDLSGKGVFGLSRGDILWRFFESKFSPTASMADTAIQGQDPHSHEPLDWKSFQAYKTTILSHMYPLIIVDIWNLPTDLMYLAPLPVVGVGVNTYGPGETKAAKAQKEWIKTTEETLGRKIPPAILEIRATKTRYEDLQKTEVTGETPEEREAQRAQILVGILLEKYPTYSAYQSRIDSAIETDPSAVIREIEKMLGWDMLSEITRQVNEYKNAQKAHG